MLEMKITITAPDLAEAINNLAAALNGNMASQVVANPTPQPTAMTQGVPAASVGTAPVSAGPSAVTVPPSNQSVAPIPAPVASAPAPAPIANATVPTAAPNIPLAAPPQYTVDQIMAAGATLMDNGKVNELMSLLHSFGVQAVMDLKQEQLGAFATAMRELGAKI